MEQEMLTLLKPMSLVPVLVGFVLLILYFCVYVFCFCFVDDCLCLFIGHSIVCLSFHWTLYRLSLFSLDTLSSVLTLQ